MINVGEAILWEDEDEAEECLEALRVAGYKSFLGGEILDDIWRQSSGVRWLRRHEFPKCLALVEPQLKDDLIANGHITIRNYSDRGESYDIHWWKASAAVKVEDLI